MQAVPEEILLKIFTYLDSWDVMNVARVNRQWRRVANDDDLWRVMHCESRALGITSLWKLVRMKFSDRINDLYIKGKLNVRHIKKKNLKPTFTKKFLKAFNDKCPNLKKLHLKQSCLSGAAGSVPLFPVSDLPANMNSLNMIHCSVPVGWFAKSPKVKLFSNLVELDMSGSSGFNDDDLRAVLLSNRVLRVLRLYCCYRIGKRSVGLLPTKCPELQELCVSGTDLRDECLLAVAGLRHLTHLEVSPHILDHVSVAGWMELVAAARPANRRREPQLLHTLDISGDCVWKVCGDEELQHLVNLPALKHLYLSERPQLTTSRVAAEPVCPASLHRHLDSATKFDDL